MAVEGSVQCVGAKYNCNKKSKLQNNKLAQQ